MKKLLAVLVLAIVMGSTIPAFAGGDASPFVGRFEGTHEIGVSASNTDTGLGSLLVEEQNGKLIATLSQKGGSRYSASHDKMIKDGSKKGEAKIVERNGKSVLKVGPFYFELNGNYLESQADLGGRFMRWKLKRVQ